MKHLSTFVFVGAVILAISASFSDQPAVKPAAEKNQKVVFVLKSSGSMIGVFGDAKRDVKDAVLALGENDQFDVITATDAKDQRTLFKKLSSATDENKKKAIQFIDDSVASGGTSMSPAVSEAIVLHPDVIWVLSNGDPGVGRAQEDLLKAAKKADGHPRINVVLNYAGDNGAYQQSLYDLAHAGGGVCLDSSGAEVTERPVVDADPKAELLPGHTSIFQEPGRDRKLSTSQPATSQPSGNLLVCKAISELNDAADPVKGGTTVQRGRKWDDAIRTVEAALQKNKVTLTVTVRDVKQYNDHVAAITPDSITIESGDPKVPDVLFLKFYDFRILASENDAAAIKKDSKITITGTLHLKEKEAIGVPDPGYVLCGMPQWACDENTVVEIKSTAEMQVDGVKRRLTH